MKWGWCSDDLSAYLEHSFQRNIMETKFTIDGWEYFFYDLEDMEQTSPGENAQVRHLRRVPWNEDWED